jgi:hypothetical protein
MRLPAHDGQSLTLLQSASYDGKARTARCTMTGNLGASGASMVSVDNRFEP